MLKNTDELKYEKAVLKTDDANNIEKTLYKIDGVDDELIKQGMSTFQPSDNVANKDKESTNAMNSYKDATSKPMISNSTMNKMNTEFNVPSSVTEADSWLSNQLEIIQSGKTSYSDDVRNMMDKILNREKFSYDVDADPLFQQALASAMNSGKQAMQDTIGQASALTGGYGSSYATSVGNQTYNAYIEDAYDQLPQYYEMAWNQYQAEGDEMYRQLGMFTDADDREYNRNVAAYDATYQHRNRMYDEAYQMYRDNKNDAFAMGNLELNMYGQKVNDAYNYYNIASNESDKQYQREYTSWQDSINQTWQVINAQSNDYQNQTNRDFQATESQKQRDWQTSENEKERNFTASENAKDRAVKSSGGGLKKSTLSTTEMKELEKLYISSGGGTKGLKAVDNYLTSIGKNEMDAETSQALKNSLEGVNVPIYYQEWNMYDKDGNLLDGANDTKNRGFLGTPLWAGDDHNDMYTNGSTSMSFDDLKKAINNSDLSGEEKKRRINALKNQSKK